MKSGFIKLHRQIKDHWVTKRADWFQGWTYILMSANFETGKVDLTEVYRELTHLFDNRAWRYFVEKLEKDEMLVGLEGFNRGSKAGYKQTGMVANWSKYHERGQKVMSHFIDEVAHNSRGARRGASAEHYAEQPTVTDEENDKPTRSQRADRAEHYAESNKNTTSKEVKEERRELPSQPYLSSEERFEQQMRTGKDPVMAQRENANHLRKLVNTGIWNDKQVQENYSHWYDAYPKELIEAVVKAAPRIAGTLKKPARFVLVDILNDAQWHLDPELERQAKELLRPIPKLNEVYEARVPHGPGYTIVREVRIMSADRTGVGVLIKQPSADPNGHWDFVDAHLPLDSLLEYKRMAGGMAS